MWRVQYSLHHAERESETTPIIIDNVNSRSLLKVVEYCTVHNDPSISAADLKAWDNKFVKVEPSVLCELASVSSLLLSLHTILLNISFLNLSTPNEYYLIRACLAPYMTMDVSSVRAAVQ
jgi:hypothetical protein